ncbi:hypothetical protein [Salisaeta icosahedral phage 1]|uniref:hypothetical protein n=1 Tax=Salisaeta icosahedral phage 1 TaxID=1183239 RepID=UPI00025EA912|nr:hypothetical protein A322_gp05 [Salisaeta icosahedral phage 1]AFJ21460.1 hypothetical protein [Salisaeta icosahedral phage 1]
MSTENSTSERAEAQTLASGAELRAALFNLITVAEQAADALEEAGNDGEAGILRVQVESAKRTAENGKTAVLGRSDTTGAMPHVIAWLPDKTEKILYKGVPPRVGDWVELGKEGDDLWGDYKVKKVTWYKDHYYGLCAICHVGQY